MSKLADHFRREYRKVRRDISFKAWLATLPQTEEVAKYRKNKAVAKGSERKRRTDKPIYVKSRSKKSSNKTKTSSDKDKKDK
jgi:hypothetical protein